MGSYARLLGRPGFDPGNVVCEVEGGVEHGPADGAPLERADHGVLALLVRHELGWVAPPARANQGAGWIQAAWVVGWALDTGELTVDYRPPPILVHHHRPERVELRHTDAQRLRIAADPTELAAFVARASSVLRPPPT